MAALQLLALVVEDLQVAEQGGLVFDLGAVAYNYDLHVGGIEIFPGGGHQVRGRDGTDFVAIGFEIVGGEFVEFDG